MQLWKVLLVAVVVAGLGAPLRSGSRLGAAQQSPEPSRAVPLDDRTFVYDSVARFNETLIGTIDAIDTALTAALAGDVALALFTIDKIAELQPRTELAAIGLLAASIIAAVAGYLFRFRAGVGDGTKPLLLIGDLSSRGEEAVIGAIESLVLSSERNLLIRFVKRVLAALAILLLVGAVMVLGVARLTAMVVH